ncbi:MAG: hypothetical protein JST00_09150 [Deltaproteobacteria bacterium]|nr:hypothetical protein [Deltaproteobacteria bacterium]
MRPDGGDAGALPRADASAAADASDGEAGSARCFPNDPNPGYGLACRVDAEMCVHDYAGISSFPRPSSCQPLTDACKGDRTCACVTKHVRCGITTSCTVLPSGLVLVVCQPD